MNNNKLKQSNYKKSFFKCTDGSAIIAFAIMIPAIFVCMFMSINYAQTLRNRARISEATNEASLVVSAQDKGAFYEDDGWYRLYARLTAMAYVNYFLYRDISFFPIAKGASIDVKYNKDKREYYVSYKQKSAPLIGSIFNVWNSESDLGNNTKSYGNVRKNDSLASHDIAFVVDFSGSATCQYGDASCNAYTENSNSQRRLDYMKKAIIDIIEKYKDHPQYHFAFVPYDIGVPVASTQTSNRDLKVGYNCSIMYELKPQYKSLNYKFWANKNIAYHKWRSLKESGKFGDYGNSYNYFNSPERRNMIYYYLDYSNYLYYSKILGPALGADDDRKLVDRGLCYIRNGGGQSGAARLACGTANEYYPLDPRNQNTIETQYASMVSLYDSMFSGNNPNVHYSFANIETIDVWATLMKLQSGDFESMIIDFERPLAPPTADFSPFQGMCQSPLYSSGFMSEEMLSLSGEDKLKKASEKLRTVISSDHVKLPYLIPFSDDINHTNNLLNVLKNSDWKPGGGTDTMTALLRTVPEMAKGKSDHKAIIIITDGKDDAGADILRDKFLDIHICYEIGRQLKSSENERKGYIARAAESVSFYYIKLDPAANSKDKNDVESFEQFGKWWDGCTRYNGRSFAAHDYEDLFKHLAKIIKLETGNFINRNQPNNAE